MTISLSKRSFLKGLFVAPAIVAASNIMPVKAFEMFTSPPPLPEGFGVKAGLIQPITSGPQKLITDLAEIQEASAYNTNKWQLVEIAGGERRWLTRYAAESLKFDYKVITEKEILATPRQIDTTVALMKEAPGSAVIWELPMMMRR